ncbi:hypothetical protein ACTXT7_006979 [Hymenolepis weldensis]
MFMPVLLAKGKIASIFPLHDREALMDLQQSWVRGFTHRQPLDAVAEYFGVKIALYFAWLGHYTTSLLAPAIFGLFAWFFVSTTSLRVDADGDANVETLQAIIVEPLWIDCVGNGGRPYVFQQESTSSHGALKTQDWMTENFHHHATPNIIIIISRRRIYRIKPSIGCYVLQFVLSKTLFCMLFQKQGALYYPVLAFFTMIWAVFFQEAWKRTNNHYTHRWGTLDKSPSLLEEPRPLFGGALEPNPITGRLEPFYPRWKRNLIVCFVTIPITLVCLIVIVGVAVGHLKLQELAEDKFTNSSIPGAKMIVHIPMILYAVNIAILNEVYRKIAVKLTELENHRLNESYNQALISKLILFQFINAFYASFYIAFYRLDLDLLRNKIEDMHRNFTMEPLPRGIILLKHGAPLM